MEFGSSHFYVGEQQEEEIFQGKHSIPFPRHPISPTPDDLDDGIANCAMEQGQVWSEEAKKGGGFDAEFLQNLVRMV